MGTARVWKPGDAIATPLELYTCVVEPEWVDYNNHMTEAAYLTAFGWGSDALFTYIGDDDAYRAAGHSFYTAETHIVYERECYGGDPLKVDTLILDVDHKRLHLHHTMYHGTTGTRLSTTEQMLVHVDMNLGKACEILPNVQQALDAIFEVHRHAPRPGDVGRVMKIRRK
ncbi:MAG: hypothetical protein RL218_451 [Actinomycetota bacterium]